MGQSLRQACDEDEQFLFDLYAGTRREETAAWNWPASQVAGFLKLQFAAQRASYKMSYPDAEHSIILEDGRPIGRMLVNRSSAAACLVDISLLPEARGRGIGSTLIRQLMKGCSAVGSKLTLQVLRTNPARALYLRLGFQRTQGDSMYDQMEWPSASPSSNEE
jgi:ribosomal protein S18 acetylase RimI-like enzyme